MIVISLSFDMCSSNDTSMIRVPNISMKTEGGGMFSVSEPGLVVSLQVLPLFIRCKFDIVVSCNSLNGFCIHLSIVQENEFLYCLAVVKSSKLNIIGRKS